jgi:hypothetical protein
MRHVLAVRPPAQRLVRVFRRQPLPAKVWRGCQGKELARFGARAAEQYYLGCESLVNDLYHNLVFERFCKERKSSRIERGLAH